MCCCECIAESGLNILTIFSEDLEVNDVVHSLKGLALPRAGHSGEIALAGSQRLRSTLAVAPVLSAHTRTSANPSQYLAFFNDAKVSITLPMHSLLLQADTRLRSLLLNRLAQAAASVVCLSSMGNSSANNRGADADSSPIPTSPLDGSPAMKAAAGHVMSWRTSQRLPLLRADINHAVSDLSAGAAPLKQVSQFSRCGICKALLLNCRVGAHHSYHSDYKMRVCCRHYLIRTHV